MKEKIKFRKQQIINSQKYLKYKDLLEALLLENRTYSTEEVNLTIENFFKRKV